MNLTTESLNGRYLFYGGALPALLIGIGLIVAGLSFVPAAQRPTSGVADLGPGFALFFAVMLIPSGLFVAGLAIVSRLPLRWLAVPSSYLSLGLGLLWMAAALGYGMSELDVLAGLVAALPGALFAFTGATGLLGWTGTRLPVPSGRTLLVLIGGVLLAAIVFGLFSGIAGRARRTILAEEGSNIRRAIWLPQQELVVGGDDNGRLLVWNPAEGAAPTELTQLDGAVQSISAAPNGRLLLVRLKEQLIMLNSSDWQPLFSITQQEASLTNFVWSADSSRLAAHNGRQVILLNIATGEETVLLTTEQGNHIRAASWSPDGKRIAAVTGTGKLTIWNAQTGGQQAIWEGDGRMGDIVWSPNGRFIITQNIRTLSLIDPTTGTLIEEWSLHEVSNVEMLVWSPDGSQLAVGSANGEILLLSGENGRVQHTFGENDHRIITLSWSSDSQWLVSLDHRGVLAVWEVR